MKSTSTYMAFVMQGIDCLGLDQVDIEVEREKYNVVFVGRIVKCGLCVVGVSSIV